MGAWEYERPGGVNGTNRLNQLVVPDILLQVSVHVLDLGADVNAANNQGLTALMGAAHGGAEQIGR
jgi:hypothetical protein